METTPGPPRVRIGTSSFSWEDWVGPFYPAGAKPGDYLRHYATRFDTVEVDATYYNIPSSATIAGWDEKTPAGFLLSAKFPRAIVHAGAGAKPDADQVLQPDPTYLVRDRFLRSMEPLAAKLGPLVLQFPYFDKQAFATPEPFYARLDRFLADLPGGFTYGVEVRNRPWLRPQLADICRQHRACLVLMDQAWMPHADEIEDRFPLVTGPYLYVRLLGDHKQIETLTTRWDREVVDRTERLQRWAAFLARAVRHSTPMLVYVNNHYAGHAPATAERLRKLLREAGLPAD
jgi:uncharacterized protein YecE (DUF72 family)